MSKRVRIIAKLEDITHEEWLELRRKGIGGSDCAAALGMSKWKSQMALWLEKIGQGTPVVEESEAMYWGSVMEPILLNEFSKRTGKEAKPYKYLLQSLDRPWQIADVDGYTTEADGSTSVIEIKTANAFSDWSDGVPLQYALQLNHYFSVTGLQRGYIVVLSGGNKFRIYEMERDEEIINNIIVLENNFWQHVVNKTQPEPDSQSDDALNQLYPQANNTSILLDDTADTIISDYLNIKAIEDDVKAKKAELENKLKAMLGQAELGKSKAGYSVKWSNSTSSRLDTAALKKAEPEIAAKYTKESTTRRFSVVVPK